jgi:hypothetical protein
MKGEVCLKCDGETFEEKPGAEVEQALHGETLKIRTPAMV